MKSNYKRLGDFIEEINIRNRDLEVDLLLGVSIKKVLIPSIANTIGSDMSKYKIISKNQFAYGPITSRNGDKISIALLQEYEKALLSQAYKVFQVKDTTQLLPEYLMMWFRRPEFDRYARCMSHGSTREAFDWDAMCDVELPVPSLEKQQEIVDDYNTVQDRIRINEKLNTALEETAQALYKHWFVDFEFPDKNGKPYKSSGGAMVYNEELDQEIPVGWEVEQLSDRISIKHGYAFKGDFITNEKTDNILLTPGNFDLGGGFKSSKLRYYFGDVPKDYILKSRDVIVTMTDLSKECDTLGFPALVPKDSEHKYLHNQRIGLVEFHSVFRWFIYYLMTSFPYRSWVVGGATGTTVKHTAPAKIEQFMYALPSLSLFERFDDLIAPIYNIKEECMTENLTLKETLSILLSKMAMVADGKELVN